jgi:hypothetical protein
LNEAPGSRVSKIYTNQKEILMCFEYWLQKNSDVCRFFIKPLTTSGRGDYSTCSPIVVGISAILIIMVGRNVCFLRITNALKKIGRQ